MALKLRYSSFDPFYMLEQIYMLEQKEIALGDDSRDDSRGEEYEFSL